MDFLDVLVVLLFLAGIVGYFWLLSFAYKQSRLWGLAVFFLSPIAAIVFAKKHWKVAKKPFLVYVSSFCLALGLSMLTAYSSIDLEPSKMARQTEFSQNGGPPKNPVLTKKALENLDTVDGLLAQMSRQAKQMSQQAKQMSQQAKDEDEQKFIRLISSYVRYKKSGFTDRSRRYIMRNATELLLLPGLAPEQRTRLREVIEDLEGKKVKDVAKVSGSTLKYTEQRAARILNESPAIRTSDDLSPPTPLFLKASEVSTEIKQQEQSSSSFNKKISEQTQAQSRRREMELNEDLPSTKKISFRQAQQYIGSQISFINSSGFEEKCFLLGVSSAEIECEKRFKSGTFSTRYSRSEVQSLKVFKY